MTCDLNARNKQILDAYTDALAERDPANVEIEELLPHIFDTVPGVTVDEIQIALEWGSRQYSKEVRELEAEMERRKSERRWLAKSSICAGGEVIWILRDGSHPWAYEGPFKNEAAAQAEAEAKEAFAPDFDTADDTNIVSVRG